jgi:hypothetical protein
MYDSRDDRGDEGDGGDRGDENKLIRRNNFSKFNSCAIVYVLSMLI